MDRGAYPRATAHRVSESDMTGVTEHACIHAVIRYKTDLVCPLLSFP